MPVLPDSGYRPPFVLWNGHVQTVYPVLFRPLPAIAPRRERIATPDGDFLDLDWHAAHGGRPAPRRLAIILHGLEGHSRRKYAAGMARALARRGWTALAWNFRGCGGEPNRRLVAYHSGLTEDLRTVLTHALSRAACDTVALVGFSIGGNMVLKYLGEDPGRVPAVVRRAVAISVPCDLAGAAEVIARPANRLYTAYFLRSLTRKMREKHARFGAAVDVAGLSTIRTIEQFDERYVAPLFGFAGAQDYYRRASCLPHLGAVRVPTLMIAAADDPFLSPSCYPYAAARANPDLFLEVPKSGGHVGFVERNAENEYWSERRTAEFLEAGA